MKNGGAHSRRAVTKKSEGITTYIPVGAVALALVTLVTLLLWHTLHGRPQSLQLHMNGYGLLSTAALVSNLVAFVFILRIKERTNELMWFSAFLLSMASWAAGEAVIRFSATPAAALFWSPISTPGSVLMPITLFMFALSYTNSKRAQHPIIFPLLLGGAVLLSYVDARSNLLTQYSAQKVHLLPWGYLFESGPAYILVSAWAILLSGAAFVLFMRYRKRATEPVLRQQSKLFMLAIAIPLLVGTFTDGILPTIHDTLLPPMSVMFLTITGIIICYGIIRHSFFSFTPGMIAPQILDTINEAVIALKPNLSISYVNGGAERLFGMSAVDLTHTELTKLLGSDWNEAKLRTDIFDPLSTTTFHTIDAVEFHSDEGPITTKLSVTKIINEKRSYGYVMVLTDITAIAHTKAVIERQVAAQTKLIRQARSRLISSIDSLEFGFIMTDTQPEVIMINKSAHVLFCGDKHHPASECKVATMEHIQVQLGTSTSITDAIRTCLKTHKPQGIKLLAFHDRSWRLFVSPVVDGTEAIGTAVLFQDITEEQILSRSRDEFFSIASHELRTPLTAIKGNTTMLLDYFPEVFKDDGAKEMVTDIHDSADRLIEIVNDFLDMSRLEQHQTAYKLEKVHVTNVVRTVMKELRPALASKHIYLKLGSGLGPTDHLHPVIADPTRLAQVLYNLVQNGLKFTEHGGITIKATQTSDSVHILVSDTGRGIDPSMQSLLFHKFQQANSSLLTRDTTRGTGVGLYISRLIAEGMGGTLELAQSAPNKGSTFVISLPKATPHKLKNLKRIATTDTQTGLTVGSTLP